MIQFHEATHAYTDPDTGWVYSSVTQVIAGAGLHGDAARFWSEYTAERGRKAHKVIEYHVKGILVESSVDPALVGYYEAYKQFESDTKFCVSPAGFVEHILYSVPLRVAGRVDLIGPCWQGKGSAIVDIKTSASPAPATGIQLAGYEELYGVHPELPQPRRFALHLKTDGKYKLIEYSDPNDRLVFLAAATTWNWKKENVKG